MFWTRFQAARGVRQTYDDIAFDFARTRQKSWQELESLFQKTRPGSRTLDLGCGNGRLIPLLRSKDCRVTGVDISENLLGIAAAEFPDVHFVRADMRELPFPENEFDEVWAVASFHHLCRHKDQLQAVREAFRVLKPRGQFILTFWNLWNLPEYAPQKQAACRRAAFFFPLWRKQDFLIPWGKEKRPRYYYAFESEEVERLARQAGFSLLECWGSAGDRKTSFAAAKNICLRFQK